VIGGIRSILLQNSVLFKSATILDEVNLCSSYQYFLGKGLQKRKIIVLDDVPDDIILSKFIPFSREVTTNICILVYTNGKANVLFIVTSGRVINHDIITHVINLSHIEESDINETTFQNAAQLLTTKQSIGGLPVMEALKKYINGSPLLLNLLVW
jgi:hypothetical protein